MVERLRKIGKERRHLAGVFQEPPSLSREEASGSVEVGPVADAGEDVVQVLVGPPRVAHAVRRDEREAERPASRDERLVAMLLLAEAMALELDVQPAGEDRAPTRELGARGVQTTRRERARDRSLVPSRERVQSDRVLAHRVGRNEGLPFHLSERAGGQEPAEVAVSAAVLDEKRQPRPARPRGGRRGGGRGGKKGGGGGRSTISPPGDESADAGGLRRLVETGRAIDAVGVDERHGGKTAPGGLFHEIFREGTRRRETKKADAARSSAYGRGPGAGAGRQSLRRRLSLRAPAATICPTSGPPRSRDGGPSGGESDGRERLSTRGRVWR